jgi:SAM-dependent methyltransferase
MSEQHIHQWLETSLGQYLLDYEQRYFDKAVTNIFGYNALQIGLPEINFLRANRIPLQFSAGIESGDLRTNPDFLPIATASMDLVLLPHILEFSANPHQILREVHRILMPEGRLIISGFNPVSLWGTRRYFAKHTLDFPWSGNFIALSRLKDWLKLLDFEMAGGRLCCYAPPLQHEKWRRRFYFMEAAGDRWWPISGGVYLLQAIKHINGMRVIKPGWKRSLAGKKRMSTAGQRFNDNVVEPDLDKPKTKITLK